MYGLEIYLSSRKKKMNEWKEENNKAKNKTNKQTKENETRNGIGYKTSSGIAGSDGSSV